MIKSLWEKVDGKLGIVIGILLTVTVIWTVIQFAAWAGPIVEKTRFLRWIFGWLF